MACVVGLLLIFAGIENVRTRTAEESGRRRGVNALLGRSNTYEGRTAVTVGVVRIIAGVCAIIFGIVFVFIGPVLAK
ncbi:MAG: hypothetical protein KDA44_23755 [Planctomycetales bacterium]|nr:hypothetical protein [Planctomycetales bacterium]